MENFHNAGPDIQSAKGSTRAIQVFINMEQCIKHEESEDQTFIEHGLESVGSWADITRTTSPSSIGTSWLDLRDYLQQMKY